MDKKDVYKREFEKLTEIFKDVESSKQQLVEGLIKDAAFLFAENYELRNLIDEVGLIKIHNFDKSIQKQTEAGKQYLKNINSYSVIIKSLNGVLMKNAIEEDDPFDNWLKEQVNNNE